MDRTKPDPLDHDGRKSACRRCGGFTIHRQTGGRRRWWCERCGPTVREPAYLRPEHVTPVERPTISTAGRAAIEWEPGE